MWGKIFSRFLKISSKTYFLAVLKFFSGSFGFYFGCLMEDLEYSYKQQNILLYILDIIFYCVL